MASAQELAQSCSTICTLPEVYLHVRDIVDNPASTMDNLANALKLDPAISSRLLNMGNGQVHGLPKQVDCISQAVNLIGVQSVRDLVAATTIGRTFTGMTAGLIDLPAFWRKSLLCALVAEKIAKASGADDSERSFVLGLLRDVGHLVLYQTAPKLAQSTLIEAAYLGAPLAEVEQASIGCDFTEVGAELIRLWNMPTSIEQAVRHQLRPNGAREFMPHASIVHLAGNIADHAEVNSTQAGQWSQCDPLALSDTRLNADDRPALLKEAHAQLQETIVSIYPLAKAA